MTTTVQAMITEWKHLNAFNQIYGNKESTAPSVTFDNGTKKRKHNEESEENSISSSATANPSSSEDATLRKSKKKTMKSPSTKLD